MRLGGEPLRLIDYTATSNGSATSAGPGFVLGIPANYRSTYPGELTQLIGATQGALIAQQLAANLAVGLGDQITIERAGLPTRGCVSPV